LQKKEGFKSGMKERVGDGKLIIISMAVSGINNCFKTTDVSLLFLKKLRKQSSQTTTAPKIPLTQN